MKFYITEVTKLKLEAKILELESREPFIQYVAWKHTYGEWKAYKSVLENCVIIKEEDYECKDRD